MKRTVYLDNAATTFPKPESVYQAMDGFYRRCGVNPGRSGSDAAREAGDLIAETRRALHAFFGNPDPDPNRLVFAASATDAVNTALLGLCGEGSHVVSTRMEHNSVLRPLWELTAAGRITHDLVPADGRGFVDPDDVVAAIGPATRLVVLNHASNVLGSVQDAAAVGRACRERGVPLLLDVSQTAGAVPIDMAAMNVDVAAFAGHKSLLGPMGVGGLAVGPGIEIEPSRWGGTGVRSAERGHPRDYPWRLEAGTPNLPGLAGLKAGLDHVTAEGVETIRTRELEIFARLAEGVEALEGVRRHGPRPDEPHVAVAALTVDGMPSDEAGMRLDVDHDVLTRTGLQCAPLVHEDLGTVGNRGTVRMGLGPFNTVEDVERALAGLADCAAAASRRA